MRDSHHLYLTILRGPDPREATAVCATEDQALIRRVIQEIARTAGASEGPPPDLLERGGDSGEGDDQ